MRFPIMNSDGLSRSVCPHLRRALLVLLLGATGLACGGDGTGGPTGGGTWPVPDLAGLTIAPSASAEVAALAGPSGAAINDSTVTLTNARTGESTSSLASALGAFVGTVDSRPGDTIEVRLHYDGQDTEPALTTLPSATDAITIADVSARMNRDGGMTGVTGTFTTSLGHRPTARAFSTSGVARVSDSALDGAPNVFMVLLEAEIGETVIVHLYDAEDPSTTTEYVEVTVTP